MHLLTWQFLLCCCCALIIWLSYDHQSYVALFKSASRQIAVLSCALICAILWRIKAGVLSGLDLHILGVTAITLILGWRLAILATLLACGLLILFSQLSLMLLPYHLLFTALLPICLSYLFFLLCYHCLAKHFFIYIFVCTFLTAAVVACFKIVSSGLFYYLIGEYTFIEISENYLYLCAIIWFPEAMLNGMAITLLITYRPHWVKTFYDKDYLNS
ncbi:energy-coupling factor ABC transporter permease [Pseudoalteromonas mariniglutinosa]|uniref:energy-coupling factor ABC transporter permease n=1 Tax=Pseudoalteromonas mariniglutinosa TaxID=206042 RepID=UPI00384B1F1E